MTFKKMIFFLVTLGLNCHAGIQLRAQEGSDTTEVGIIEHLGSVIPMDISFNTEDNNNVTLSEVIQKPTILVLIYFDCPGICPTILASVSTVIEKMEMVLGKDYEVVTVSFNSNDTPERAKDKKNQFLREKGKMHPGDWHYLTGDSLAIHKLTEAVGFRFIQAGNDFIHPACITILSPTGKITRYLYGTTFLPFDVKMALIEAQRGQTRPTINRVLDFCYSYDPSGRRYSLEVTKVSGIIILFIAFIFLITLLIRSKVKKSKSNESQT